MDNCKNYNFLGNFTIFEQSFSKIVTFMSSDFLLPACRIMSGYMTYGQIAANSNTWINTFVCDACQTIITIIIDFTFTTTASIFIVWISFETRQTVASARSISFSALSVITTWRWMTWCWFWLWWCYSFVLFCLIK